MVQDGVYGPERKTSNGRPKWRLVDETLGHELDVSSMYCIPVKSKAIKKTVDADKEEWDILDGTSSKSPVGIKSSDVPMGDSAVKACRPIRKQPLRARAAIKPLSGKIALVKARKAAPVDHEYIGERFIQSPLRASSRNTPNRSPHQRPSITSRSPRRTPLWSPGKRHRSTPPRVEPRWTPKQNSEDDLNPAGRKARKINSSGARRAVLQG
jgi:hypothetical protein